MFAHAVSQEIAEELGFLSSDSSEEEVLTTRVVRRRVIIQVTAKCLGDDATSVKERDGGAAKHLNAYCPVELSSTVPRVFITRCLRLFL